MWLKLVKLSCKEKNVNINNDIDNTPMTLKQKKADLS